MLVERVGYFAIDQIIRAKRNSYVVAVYAQHLAAMNYVLFGEDKEKIPAFERAKTLINTLLHHEAIAFITHPLCTSSDITTRFNAVKFLMQYNAEAAADPQVQGEYEMLQRDFKAKHQTEKDQLKYDVITRVNELLQQRPQQSAVQSALTQAATDAKWTLSSTEDSLGSPLSTPSYLRLPMPPTMARSRLPQTLVSSHLPPENCTPPVQPGGHNPLTLPPASEQVDCEGVLVIRRYSGSGDWQGVVCSGEQHRAHPFGRDV